MRAPKVTQLQVFVGLLHDLGRRNPHHPAHAPKASATTIERARALLGSATAPSRAQGRHRVHESAFQAILARCHSAAFATRSTFASFSASKSNSICASAAEATMHMKSRATLSISTPGCSWRVMWICEAHRAMKWSIVRSAWRMSASSSGVLGADAACSQLGAFELIGSFGRSVSIVCFIIVCSVSFIVDWLRRATTSNGGPRQQAPRWRVIKGERATIHATCESRLWSNVGGRAFRTLAKAQVMQVMFSVDWKNVCSA
jgi:hypothetical protein